MSWESEKKKLEAELKLRQSKVDMARAQLSLVIGNLKLYGLDELKANLNIIKDGLSE